jgi:hypothetical protein
MDKPSGGNNGHQRPSTASNSGIADLHCLACNMDLSPASKAFFDLCPSLWEGVPHGRMRSCG